MLQAATLCDGAFFGPASESGVPRDVLAAVTCKGLTIRRTEAPVHERVSLSALAGIEIDDLLPVRRRRGRKGQRNKFADFAICSTGQIVECESLEEGQTLLMVDFQGDARKIVPQPFELRYVADRARVHTPDFFVELRDGRRLVIDVKPRARADEAFWRQVVAMVVASREAGWLYWWAAEPLPTPYATVDWLSAYRRFRVSDSALVDSILGFVGTRRVRFDAIVREAKLTVLTLPVLFWLLWQQDLVVDLDEPLTGASLVWRKAGSR